MWALDNTTGFAADRAWVRDQNGAEVWIVAVKGTYTINPDGTTTLAEKQEAVRLGPEYLGAPGKSSLRYESDLIRTKQSTDVILHGHAYAPRGGRASQVDVTLNVANINKTLRVFGDRKWNSGLLGLEISKPLPFDRMPITYERAFGGTDQRSDNPRKHGWEPRNPVGTGFGVEEKHVIGQALPNVEFPNELITSWEHRPRPAGFGPFSNSWSPRLALAGTYDAKWQKERHPLLPVDFDDRFFQCVPADQQAAGHLRGGEAVELLNLTPAHVCGFQLPREVFGFETSFSNGEKVTHRAVLHTVILEPDEHRVIMVWHTSLACHPLVNKLLSTRIIRKKLLFSNQTVANET